MIKKIKKRAFWILALQRYNILGKSIFSICQSLLDALNNKIGDSNLNGEFWFLKNLNHSEIKVVFDVGANVGKWSLKLKEFNPHVVIHAFEPVPETFVILNENTKTISNFTGNQVALSDIEDQINFNYYPRKPSWSSAINHILNENSILFKANSIQGYKYCIQNNVLQIDLLKIDTEGFESKVLFGFKEMFDKKQIRMVQFEYGPMAIKSKFLLSDFYNFFEDIEFEVGKIYPNRVDFRPYSLAMENFVLSNFVAIRKDCKKMLFE